MGQRCYRLLFPSFLSLPVLWAILNQLRFLTYEGDTVSATQSALVSLQNAVKWAIFGLSPFAAGVAIHWLFVRLRKLTALTPTL